MVQTTELFQLALALVLAPLVARSLRSVKIPGRRYIGHALLFAILSYVFTILEGFVAPDSFNLLEHLAVAGCGVFFGLSAWAGRVHWYGRGSGDDS